VSRDNEDYLRFIRNKPCSVCRALPSDPDHHPTRGSGRWSDERTWPLCRKHHTERHAIGILEFQRRYKVKVETCMAELQEEWRSKNET
jgi:hypothetical protein